jgi:ABC-type transport system involved in multi-copper enzyme maturation permease subunit
VSFLALTLLTFREAVRRRLVVAVGIMGGLFLLLFGAGFAVVHHQARFSAVGERPEAMNFFLLTGLYGVNFLVVALTVLASADTISGEIASGTLQVVVTKPLRRSTVILAKWTGLAVMLAAFTAGMGAAMIALVAAISGYVPPNPVPGLATIFLEGLVLLSLSLLLGTRLTTLAGGVIVFMLHALAFVAGWMEQAGAFLRSEAAARIGVVVSLLVPSEALWRRAAWLMQEDTMRRLGFGPFATASAPSGAMVAWAALYAALALVLAVRLFRNRDL